MFTVVVSACLETVTAAGRSQTFSLRVLNSLPSLPLPSHPLSFPLSLPSSPCPPLPALFSSPSFPLPSPPPYPAKVSGERCAELPSEAPAEIAFWGYFEARKRFWLQCF